MRIVLEKVDNTLFEWIKERFSPDFLKKLVGPYKEQKLIKYWYLKDYFSIDDEKQLLTIWQNHQYNNEYFSTSYSWDLIFLIVDSEKIWIDLEVIWERSNIMLDYFTDEDYAILWMGKDWKAFYTIRTAEEALLKALDLKCLEETKNFKLIGSTQINIVLDKLSFSRELCFKYNDVVYYVLVWEKEKICYSVCKIKK